MSTTGIESWAVDEGRWCNLSVSGVRRPDGGYRSCYLDCLAYLAKPLGKGKIRETGPEVW